MNGSLTCKRDWFSLPAELHYLNCAYMSPLPKRVEEAGVAGLLRKRSPVSVRESDFFGDANAVRRLFARLVNVSNESRIAIVPSVSYGIAVASKNLPVAMGQNIVIAGEQFPANVYAWRRCAQDSDGELRIVPRPDCDQCSGPWNEALLHAIDDATAVVALAPLHWTDGTRFDLETIGARARKVGAALVVDGTQSVGALPFDVERIRPDALVCGAYKWLMGPYGIGVAYFGERFDTGAPIEEPWIVRAGSEDFRRLVDYEDEYRDGAIRYDAGGMANFITVPMLKASLELLQEWTTEAIQSYCADLVEPLVEEARRRGWLVEEEAGRAAHLMGIRLPTGTDFDSLNQTLRERKVAVSMRGRSVRISPHVYNDKRDIEALLGGLDEVLESVG